MKYEDDIHNATPARLTEMLEDVAECLLEYEENVTLTQEECDAVEFEYELLTEAARRLRELNKPTYEDYE